MTVEEQKTHLVERHLNVDRYSGIYVCDDVVIFTLWNLSGQMVGYQQYRKDADKSKKNNPREGKYYTSLHGDKITKPIGVWGLESLPYRPDVLVIVEGIFDACRLHNEGIPAIALMSASVKHFHDWLLSLGRKIYKVEDDHGSMLGAFPNLPIPDGRGDIGECTDEEVTQMITMVHPHKRKW